MKKKISVYIMITLVFAVMLTGCGSRDKQQDTSDTTADNATVSDASSDVAATPEDALPDMDSDGYYITDDTVGVTAELANVYVSADEGSAIYMLAEQGITMNRTGYNDVWTRVVIDNTDFFVLTGDVCVVETTEAATEEGAQETATSGDAARAKIVVIDACNQAQADTGTEEIGPGSGETKACATEGSTGTTFGTKESELNLEYAMLLKDELETRGYSVILTRDSDDVDLSNKSRAELANSSGAAAYIRIAMNESTNSELSGVMAVCMTQNSPYNSELYTDSKNLASRLIQGITENVDTVNRGIYETDQMTAVNWSSIPVAEIYLGYLTNSTDEGNLTADEYKAGLVKGLADGIDYFIQ